MNGDRPDQARLYRLSHADLPIQKREWIRRSAEGVRTLYPYPGAGMDCVWLLEQLSQHGYPRIRFGKHPLSHDGKVEAVSVFDPRTHTYLILVDPRSFQYPFENSRDRRTNFTLAHELGHIFLGHADLPDTAKYEALRRIQDAEADEFAGCLLMPQSLLQRCQYHSVPRVAAHFMVSRSALWQRLNNLRKLHWLTPTQPPRPCCPTCGNLRYNLWQSAFCPVCAKPVQGTMIGPLPTPYGEDIPGNFCTACARPLPGFARYCDACAAPSAHLRRGLLKPWHQTLL